MTALLSILLVLGTAIALWTIARKPEWGAPFFAFVLFIRLSDALRGEYGTPSIFQFMAPGLVLIILARWLFSGERAGPGWKPALWLLGVYGTICLLSLLYAQDPERTTSELLKQIDGVLIVIVMSSFIREPRDFRRVIWALLAAGFFLTSLTAVQQLTGQVDSHFAGFSRVEIRNLFGDQAGGRAEGPVSANYYAILLVLLVPIAVERALHERSPRMRTLARVTLLLVIASIVWTYSRGALVALGVVVLLLAFWLNLRRFLIVGGAAMLILPFVLPQEFVERAATFGQVFGVLQGETPQDNAIRGRLSEVTSAARMFGDAPLLGVGYGNFELHYPRYARDIALDSRRTDRAAHNLYLEVAAETGVVGLIAFCLFLFYPLHGVRRAYQRLDPERDEDLRQMLIAFGIGLVGYLTGSLFLHLSYPRYFWLLFGIAFGLEALGRRPSESVAETIPGRAADSPSLSTDTGAGPSRSEAWA